MANPIFAGNQDATTGGTDIKSLLKEFSEFKRNYTGDPQKAINDLVTSGKVTQRQVDEATKLAKMLERWL